ncbi:TadA family conjugal transfer-associated ATPase [Agromyces aurantiacus]|uniref:TadA family conjugal transfer-associated ATPase n=1 Tax=Agromyces aurantiacus TaxID=165814 RepID=A0ABV9R783_9MICO|nr:TadA family conjugal transfer-associated ATPase [Agromyces aurantiacus]MBM7504012.1 pilus assembly protein CpaF [Agromyces aurantiacus]
MPRPFVAVPSWESAVREDAGAATGEAAADPTPASPWSPEARSVGARTARVSRGPIDPLPSGEGGTGDDASHGRGVRAASIEGVSTDDLALLGPLAPYAASGPVTDLFVNGGQGLWVDRGAGPEREPAWSAGESEVRALAVQLIARGGRHIDEATPAVDVRLGRGIRVHAVLPPLSPGGTLLSVRVPRIAGFSLAVLARAGMLDAAQEQSLRSAVRDRRNLLVTGAGGSGKTTLLGALLGEAGPRERIVLIEDVAELRIAHPHVVALEARQANLEGSGRIGLDTLLREALRMRPDRLVVGECRGPELRELLAALNTGHDGGAGTLHANSLDDVPARLEALGSTAGMSADAVARQAVSAFDLVVHLERVDGRRRVGQVGRLRLDGARLEVAPC